MKLTLEQVAKAILHFETTWKSLACEVCGHDSWSVADELFSLPIFPGVGPRRAARPEKSIPVVVAVCKKCHNLRTFGAIDLGFVPADSPGSPAVNDVTGAPPPKSEAGNG